MKKILVFGLVGVGVGLWLWSDRGRDDAGELDRSVTVIDQIWIDHMPKTPKDKLHVFAMSSEARLGVFNHSSAYEGDFKLFEFRTRKGELDIKMLQTDKKHHVHFELTRKGCGKEFDACLRLKGAPTGPKVYGTKREWKIEGGLDPQALDGIVRAD